MSVIITVLNPHTTANLNRLRMRYPDKGDGELLGMAVNLLAVIEDHKCNSDNTTVVMVEPDAVGKIPGAPIVLG